MRFSEEVQSRGLSVASMGVASGADYESAAVVAWTRVLSASSDLIHARFELGRLVYQALHEGTYGDAVVVGMAMRLSRESGKLVTPAILYEVARLYAAFGGQYARVEALRTRLRFPLTYSYLVRTCVPIVTRETAWNAAEWDGRQHVELSRLEGEVLQIEEQFTRDQAEKQARLARVSEAVPIGGESADGFTLVCQQSVGYQHVAVQTLLGRLVETVSLLERKGSVLCEADRMVLEACADRCAALGLVGVEGAVPVSAGVA